MKVVIDTNSLLSLVRYYLPFDKKGVLFKFIKSKIENGDIIIIDKVLEECTYNSKGLVLEKLPYLTEKTFLKSAKLPYKTDSLLVPNTKQFFHQLNNVFVNNIVKRSQGLSDVEFENRKTAFIESADMKQVILSLNLKNQGEQVIIVTEETESSNDNKLFKKIPAICKELEIDTMTLPELIAKYDGIDIDFQ
ncbi:hypothetical protein CHU92_03605 [Flavobacterium cyanobacteriorum]|uniref:DUF4411 domain-containing protein n=1 Tax=Flavobacterium cyanobacteriorum TaxID=2022802 RepID=A0A255ZP20_9FLAO|nr:DUF4411 family protein [Flavobacterium cyanobacteriorum]OYQ43253.1 hypothetical protein CHU92_03605 [Flavobacterium cyanobacteriorum]